MAWSASGAGYRYCYPSIAMYAHSSFTVSEIGYVIVISGRLRFAPHAAPVSLRSQSASIATFSSLRGRDSTGRLPCTSAPSGFATAESKAGCPRGGNTAQRAAWSSFGARFGPGSGAGTLVQSAYACPPKPHACQRADLSAPEQRLLRTSERTRCLFRFSRPSSYGRFHALAPRRADAAAAWELNAGFVLSTRCPIPPHLATCLSSLESIWQAPGGCFLDPRGAADPGGAAVRLRAAQRPVGYALRRDAGRRGRPAALQRLQARAVRHRRLDLPRSPQSGNHIRRELACHGVASVASHICTDEPMCDKPARHAIVASVLMRMQTLPVKTSGHHLQTDNVSRVADRAGTGIGRRRRWHGAQDTARSVRHCAPSRPASRPRPSAWRRASSGGVPGSFHLAHCSGTQLRPRLAGSSPPPPHTGAICQLLCERRMFLTGNMARTADPHTLRLVTAHG